MPPQATQPTPTPHKRHNNTPQARFKEAFRASSLCIGQELYNDVAAPLWVRQALMHTAAKAFSSTARVQADGAPR